MDRQTLIQVRKLAENIMACAFKMQGAGVKYGGNLFSVIRRHQRCRGIRLVRLLPLVSKVCVKESPGYLPCFVNLVFIPDASLSAFSLLPRDEVSLPVLCGPLSWASLDTPGPHFGFQTKDVTLALSHLLSCTEAQRSHPPDSALER